MALIKCTGCGHDVSDKATECPHCGHPISQENCSVCKECGIQLPKDATVCPNCGCPTDNTKAVKMVYYDEEPPKKKKKRWIWALVVALLCLIGGGYYGYTHFANGNKNGVNLADSLIVDDKDAIVELTPKFVKSLEVYDELAPFSEGYAAVKRGKKWGYINVKGEEIIPCSFDYADIFSEGLAAVSKDGKWGYINTKGEEIIPCSYDNIRAFGDGLAAVFQDGKWGWINTKGEVVIPIKIEAKDVGQFNEGLVFICKDYYEFSFINKSGEKVFGGKMEPEFYRQGYRGSLEPKQFPLFQKGYVYIASEDSSIDNYTFNKYDKKGKKYEKVSIDELSEYIQFADYENEGKKGIKKGKNIVIPAKYDFAGSYIGSTCIVKFTNGVAIVGLYEYQDGGEVTIHYGYVDLNGNDTFSEELKELCRKSKELAYQEDDIDESSNYDWLQGHWVDTDSGSGYPLEVIIDGDNLIQKINGQVCYNGSYQFNGEFIVYNDGNDFWSVDNERQVLTYDGSPMRKVNRNSSSSSTSSNSSYNNSSSSSNELAKYDEKISQYYPIMEEAYQQFMRDVRSGGYTTITPPNSYYELSNACSSVGAAANEARKICIKKGDTAGEQKYERIWEREKRLYDSAYQILGNLH